LAWDDSAEWHGWRRWPYPAAYRTGKTFVYEFEIKASGTFMYHPHSDEMVQMAMGMMGMFIVHPPRSEVSAR
jgi:FtsP/CotA-like multicopper oxidase with cupredoxin domain